MPKSEDYPGQNYFHEHNADIRRAEEKRVNRILEAYKKGRQEEHFNYCGWCRQGLECPYK
jgi:hypothetical protein